MAEMSLSYVLDIGDKIEGNHYEYFLTGSKTWRLDCSSDSTSETVSASSTFSLSSFNGIKSSVVNSIKLNFTPTITSGASGGNALFLNFNGASYAFDVSTGILGADGITALNNYKSQYGKFPDVVLRFDSRVNRPPTNDDGTTKTYYCSANFKSGITIDITYQGGSLILRPSADISAEHTIPSGFSGVYQLINEEVADDATTCIGTGTVKGEAENTDTVDLTSTVALIGGAFSKKNAVSMRLVFRVNIENPTTYGEAQVKCAITAGGAVVAFTTAADTADVYETYITEAIEPYSTIIQDINSYVKSNEVLPEIELSINTYAESNGSGNGKTGNPSSAYITQAYLELYYEDDLGFNIHRKVNGTWLQVQAAYKKQSGVWVEITEDECKQELNNAPILTRGEVT